MSVSLQSEAPSLDELQVALSAAFLRRGDSKPAKALWANLLGQVATLRGDATKGAALQARLVKVGAQERRKVIVKAA